MRRINRPLTSTEAEALDHLEGLSDQAIRFVVRDPSYGRSVRVLPPGDAFYAAVLRYLLDAVWLLRHDLRDMVLAVVQVEVDRRGMRWERW